MRRLLFDIALFGLCLCLAPSRYQFGDPNAHLAAAEGLDLSGGPALPATTDVATLARTDPVALLESGLRRYRDEVQGYTCLLAKHERINGKLRPAEVVRCAFREAPFSVFMQWVEGKDEAERSLFVNGENGGNVLIRPCRPLKFAALRAVGKFYVDRPTNDEQVRSSSRFSVHEFGIAKGMERTYLAWKAAKEKGTLRVTYHGLQPIAEAGDRVCHVITRHCDPPEEEGLTAVTIAIDQENWLQVGSTLKAGEDLIGSYHFREIVFNPSFPANQFQPEIMK